MKKTGIFHCYLSLTEDIYHQLDVFCQTKPKMGGIMKNNAYQAMVIGILSAFFLGGGGVGGSGNIMTTLYILL